MRIKQVKNLLAMRDSYHPILSRLFRKYRSVAVSIIINGIVGCSCFILLSTVFLGLSFYYTSIESNQVLYIASGLIFVYSFLITIKTAYAFMYSGKDINLLKTLPITQSEVFACNFVYFYKNQIPFSLYIIASAIYALIKNNFSPKILLEGFFLAFIVPAATILFVMVISTIIHFLSHFFVILSKNKKIKFKKMSSFLSLVKYERKNFSLFSSLKTEILMQWVMSLSFTVIVLKTNLTYLSFISLYPAISMINNSSFSREGEFHNILQTLPIDSKKRIMAKVFFYLLLEIPIFVVCYGIIFAKTKEIIILFLLIPNLLFILNTSLIGLKSNMKNPKTHWTNPQEAFRMNYPVFFGCILLGIITELLAFFPEFILIKNQFIGIVVSILLNFLFFLCLQIKGINSITK